MTTTVDRPPNADRDAAGSDTVAVSVDRSELGMISIDDRVVAKLAARAAVEVPDAGGAAPRILGKSLDGLQGVRDTSLNSLPKATAEVDGSVVVVDLQISVRWPACVPEVAAHVRQHVAKRVHSLTGLHITEVTIEVTDLVTRLSPPPRVS